MAPVLCPLCRLARRRRKSCCQRLGCFPSRVVLLLAVGVVRFIIADFVDVRGVCETCPWFSLLLYDHPHHPSLCCLELIPHFFRQRPRTWSVKE